MSILRITRVWAMPSANTFDCAPIGEFVKSYLRQSKISVDPFARNKRWATYTNDLNPLTEADYHLHSDEYLLELKRQNVSPDLIIFDPPYSPHQTKECYAGFGYSMKYEDDARHGWSRTRKLMAEILNPGGILLSFGWNTVGAGDCDNFSIEELLIVCHGIGHNDTLCLAERKHLVKQLSLLEPNGAINA